MQLGDTLGGVSLLLDCRNSVENKHVPLDSSGLFLVFFKDGKTLIWSLFPEAASDPEVTLRTIRNILIMIVFPLIRRMACNWTRSHISPSFTWRIPENERRKNQNPKTSGVLFWRGKKRTKTKWKSLALIRAERRKAARVIADRVFVLSLNCRPYGHDAPTDLFS